MATLATLTVELGMDSAGFTSGIAESESKLSALGGKLKSIGTGMSAGVTAPLVALGATSISAASDLNESMSAVGTIFGESADQVKGFGGSVASELGLSRAEVLASATSLGALYDSTGATTDAMADMTNQTLTAAGDLTSFHNVAGGVPATLDIIQAGLTGEAEGLKQFGIFLTEASLQEYALAEGIIKAGEEMTEQEKVLARQGFIMANLGAAAGDQAKTHTQLAGSTRTLGAQFTDFQAQIGQMLLPTMARLVSIGVRVMTWIQGLSPQMQQIIVIVGLVAAAMGPLLIGLGMIAPALGALVPLLGVAAGAFGTLWTAILGPIGLVIAAIALFAIAYKTNFLGFADLVNWVAAQVATAFGVVVNWIQAHLIPWLDRLWATVLVGGRQIVDFLRQFQPVVAAVFGFMVEVIRVNIEQYRAWWATLQGLRGPLSEIVDWVGRVIEVLHDLWDYFAIIREEGDHLNDSLGELPGWLQPVVEWFGRWTASIIELGRQVAAVVGRVSADISRLVSWVTGIPARILAPFQALYDSFYNIGRSIITGMVNGITSLWNEFSGRVSDIIDQYNRIPSFLRPGSPSKTALEWARSVMEGLGVGIERDLPKLRRQVDHIIAAIKEAEAVKVSASLGSGPGGFSARLHMQTSPATRAALAGGGGGGFGTTNVTFERGSIVIREVLPIEEAADQVGDIVVRRVVRAVRRVNAGEGR